MAVIVASERGDQKVWLARLNLLTNDPRNPRWIRDTQAMIDGFVVDETPAY